MSTFARGRSPYSDLYFHEVEVYSSDNDVLKMVERLVVFKVDMEAIFNAHLHLHRDHLGLALEDLIWEENCEILFFCCGKFVVFGNDNSDEISDPTSHSIKSFILLFEVGELEFINLVFS